MNDYVDFKEYVSIGNEHFSCRQYLIFRKTPGWIKLCRFFVLSDGPLLVEDQLVDESQLREYFANGVYCTTLDSESETFLRIPFLARVNVSGANTWVEEEELLKEFSDVRKQLNNQPTSSDLCRDAYREFKNDPIESNRIKLKETFEKVPKHLRHWLLSFDEKNVPIRKAIWGDSFDKH